MESRKRSKKNEHKSLLRKGWDSLSSRQKTGALAISALALAGWQQSYSEPNDVSSDFGIVVEIIDEIKVADIPEPSPSPPLPEKVQVSNLKIGTYNAWYKKRDANKTINDVLDLMRGTPTTPAVDILGVQEFKGDNEPEELKDRIPLCDTCEFNAYMPDSEASAMPIIWKPAKTAVVKTDTIFLHPKEEADGATIASKWVNIVLFQDKATGQQFYVLNFHLVYGIQNKNELNLDNPQRLELLDLELGGLVPKAEEIKLTGLPAFATYDANMTASSTNIYSPKNILRDLGFIDGHDPEVPDNTPQEQGTHNDRDIDYVSVHPGLYDERVKILGSWTLGDSLISLASDHDSFVIDASFLKMQ